MFLHLHTHSYFSFLDGVLSPEELVNLARQHKMNSLALTDHDTLTGAIHFYDACLESGIKPLLGLEVGVTHPLGIGNIVLLAKNITGWSSLCRLSSLIAGRGTLQVLTLDELAELSKGLICLSGGKKGLLWKLLEFNYKKSSQIFLGELKDIFDQDLFSELQYQNTNDASVVKEIISINEKLGIPPVASNNVHYNNEKQVILQRTLSAIRQNKSISLLDIWESAPYGSYFASPEEMEKRFAELPEAIFNTLAVAERCAVVLPVGKPHYPEVKIPQGLTAIEYLRNLVNKGVKEKYGSFTPTIQQRIDFEINIIREKGYAPLFIIVKEILDYARFSDVPISSRGSAASSLIAYCLGITTPEPLALNLYFERFLNPARETPPDIDTDICSKYRAKVIQFVYDHFGRDRVAMIATVNRFQRRSALREVAKAHGLSNSEVNKLSKALGDRGWRQAGDFDVNKNDPFKTVSTAFPEDHYQTIFLEAETLIGFPRHLSIHPGGIIISPGPLYELLPTLRANKGIIITQFDLDSIERLGLIKIDLLGTRGLTVIGEVARTIKKWRPADFKSSLDVLDAIPEHDQSARDLLQSTQVIGCFAIESPGMRNTLREINANSIEDIMIALALYRPGPMTGGLKVAFVRRHRGLERISHIHPTLANLLDNTYGVILYQEQVLRIASELAGLSLADSDLLRRAMSHFDPGDQMKTLKSRFIDGSMEVSDIPEEIGEKIWELMAAFAGYGFPKAHAASYAHLAWQSIWCKAQFPAEFMAAVLAGWGGYYRQFVYINESRRLGLNPRAPHVNHSQKQFSAAYPKGKPTLYMGLDQVRSLTQRTISRILDQRPFHSLEDFLTRVDPGSKEAENLILVGAFSGLGEIPKLLSYIKAGGWRLAQPRLFDLPSQNDNPEEWELGQRVAAQKKILGIGMDAHPVELARLKTDSTTYVKNSKAKNMIQEEVLVMGIRQTIQRYHALDGSPYYILELDDSEEVLPVKLSPDFYTRHQNILSSSKPFFTAGIITREALTNMIMLEARDFKQISI